LQAGKNLPQSHPPDEDAGRPLMGQPELLVANAELSIYAAAA